jgi:hypothetical protein
MGGNVRVCAAANLRGKVSAMLVFEQYRRGVQILIGETLRNALQVSTLDLITATI